MSKSAQFKNLDKKSSLQKRKPTSRPSSSKGQLVSNTPNFGRSSPALPTPPDLLYDDSLDFSHISDREKAEQDTCGLISQEEILEKLNFDESPASHMDDMVKLHVYKYEKALGLLQGNFSKYQEDTDSLLLNLHEHVAEVRNKVKNSKNLTSKLEGTIEKAVSFVKARLESQVFSYFLPISPPRSSRHCSTIERMQKVREDYDLKLQQNESYIKSLQQANKQVRSKSTCKSYSDLAEENKKLRAELSKLLNKPN